MKKVLKPVKNTESTKINVEDRTFSLVRHISSTGVSFSLKVSFKDPKKSKGFANDSFYLRNKKEFCAVLGLMMNILDEL